MKNINSNEISCPDGKVILTKQGDKFKIQTKLGVEFTKKSECLTSYSLELIKKIIEIKGCASLCDEIQRDELYSYVQKPLEDVIFTHFNNQDFDKKRILDFGCGAGGSTVILARLFKSSEITGIELSQKLLELAEERKSFYRLKNIHFLSSKSGTELPNNIGKFHFIFLNAVYEHFLPNERKVIFPLLLDLLKPGGHIIINETPHRWFPVETHTTEGMPFINYLPKTIVHYIVNNFSKRLKKRSLTWTQLLRAGIRGGSITEIKKIFKQAHCSINILKPNKQGIKDRIDLFDMSLSSSRLSDFKQKTLYKGLKFLKLITGIILTPTLAFVIKKRN